jgi:hypothetical protein
MERAAVEAIPPHLPAEEAAALFYENEQLRRQVVELQADLARWKNGHRMVLSEWEYWFKKCMEFYGRDY